VCISLKNNVSWGMNLCSLMDAFRRFRRNLYQTTRRQSQKYRCLRIHEYENFRSHVRIFLEHFPLHVEHAGVARCSLVPCPSPSVFRSRFVLSLLPQRTCFSTASWTCVGGFFVVQFLFRYTRTHSTWQKFLYTAERHLSGLIRTASHPDMQ